MREESERIRQWYDLRAHFYDLRRIYLGRRKRAIEKLQLKEGETVVDLACGTGLNLPYLVKGVGSVGKVIAADYSEGMLGQARLKAKRGGWKNIVFLQEDASKMTLPSPVDAVICAYAICTLPQWEVILRRAASWLRPGGRLVVLDVHYAKGLFSVFNPFGKWWAKHLSSHADYSREAWHVLKEELKDVHVEWMACGMKYLCWGRR